MEQVPGEQKAPSPDSIKRNIAIVGVICTALCAYLSFSVRGPSDMFGAAIFSLLGFLASLIAIIPSSFLIIHKAPGIAGLLCLSLGIMGLIFCGLTLSGTV